MTRPCTRCGAIDRYPSGGCRACANARYVPKRCASGIVYGSRAHWSGTEHNRYRKFGLEPDAYNAMVTARNGRCDMCGVASPKPLHVDHDHTTGRIRGLLCSPCNTGLGHYEKLRRAAEIYLRAAG